MFLSRDPFESYAQQPYSRHYYQYGYSDPVSNTDPSGRDPWWTDPNDRSSVCAYDPMGVYTRNDCTDRRCRFNSTLDPSYRCPSAWDDPTIGFFALLCPIVLPNILPEAIVPLAEGAGTGACADGDCTNELEELSKIVLNGNNGAEMLREAQTIVARYSGTPDEKVSLLRNYLDQISRRNDGWNFSPAVMLPRNSSVFCERIGRLKEQNQ